MFVKGQVVVSEAGRDKNTLYAVTDEDEQYVYVCDGKKHPLTNPKRKNPRHLKDFGVNLPESQLVTNRALRTALAKAGSECKEGGKGHVQAG